ncbi:hypothetical protein C8Q79DRAFT_1008049 [Trametes meyenii]|nr:hypothetical protein C8Q79DRAFT_1008049 [Trametes meyenii]
MSTPTSSDAGYLSERPSSPIMSSPGKAPHTGPNGLMYTRAGGGVGFDLDDEDERDTDNTIELLRYATDTLDGQHDNPEEGFFDRAKARMSATIRWAYGLDKTTNPVLRAQASSASITALGGEDSWSHNTVIQGLTQAIDHIQALRERSDQQQLSHTKKCVQGTLKWARGIKRHAETRCTMPKTNVRGSSDPDPSIVIGYRYREKTV